MNKSLLWIVAVVVGSAASDNNATGRGFGGYSPSGGDNGEFGSSYFVGRGDFDPGSSPSGVFDANGSWRGASIAGLGSNDLGAGGLRPSFDAPGLPGTNLGGFRYGLSPAPYGSGNLIGMPTDAGLHFANGAAVSRGPQDTAAQRAAALLRGFSPRHGMHQFSPTYFRAQGLAVRRWYVGRGWFTPNWITGHPWGWKPTQLDATVWTNAAWTSATWPSLATWLGWASSTSPLYFSDVAYDEGDVFYGDQFQATADDYYRQAADLAAGGAMTPPTNADWLALGIFAIAEGNQRKPFITLQLAIDKEGLVRGNCVSDVSDTMSVVVGAFNKKTQRVAWTIGDAKGTVYDTGLYSLTMKESPGWIHFGKDRVEPMLLVRLQQDSEPESR